MVWCFPSDDWAIIIKKGKNKEERYDIWGYADALLLAQLLSPGINKAVEWLKEVKDKFSKGKIDDIAKVFERPKKTNERYWQKKLPEAFLKLQL